MNQTTTTPILWAIVELMGHQQIAGAVSEQQLGGNFLRIDVPETTQQGAFSRLVNPNTAVYAINPVTEDVARLKAEQLQVKPLEPWDIQTMNNKLLRLKQAEQDRQAREYEAEYESQPEPADEEDVPW